MTWADCDGAVLLGATGDVLVRNVGTSTGSLLPFLGTKTVILNGRWRDMTAEHRSGGAVGWAGC